MSLFGPITDAERRGWQRDAHHALGTLLAVGAREKLPPLTWTVQTGARLVGQASTVGDTQPGQVFDAWFTALSQDANCAPLPVANAKAGVPNRRETTGTFARPRWVGAFRVACPSGMGVEVTVLAEWSPPEREVV